MLNGAFYFLFYALPFVLPFVADTEGFLLHSGLHIMHENRHIPKYTAQFPNSVSEHPLMFWPMGQIFDLI